MLNENSPIVSSATNYKSCAVLTIDSKKCSGDIHLASACVESELRSLSCVVCGMKSDMY
jgi:hypothetical protein